MDSKLSTKCSYFQVRKNRGCHMEVYGPSQFCVFHIPSEEKALLPRYDLIDCPVDSTHQVSKSKLNKHLKICNKFKIKVEMQQNPFFQKNYNIQNTESGKETKKTKLLQDLSHSNAPIFNELIDSIPLFFQRALTGYQELLKQQGSIIENVEQYILDENVVEFDEISANEKDMLQVDKLVGVLKDHNLLNSSNCFIEYGAGKGRLTHGVAVALKLIDERMACHVLIERESRRQKYDKFHRDNPYFIRLRMDIMDFHLDSLKSQLPQQYFQDVQQLSYVGICKHMCGAGTDLTINSLLKQSEQKFRGITCATCCHHLCDSITYVVRQNPLISIIKNIEFLEEIGVRDDLRELLFACSSWYVSGAIPSLVPSTITSQKRTLLGKMAKRIIDIGRLLHICEKTKLRGHLVKYCEINLSPENFAIVVY